MKAVSGNGSRVIRQPDEQKVEYHARSQAVLGGYPPGLRRVDQGLVVALFLVGVGLGESAIALLERGRATE